MRLLLFLLLAAHASRAQKPFTKEFWLNESNIPVNVNALLFTQDHYLWIASDNGLYRFNGRNFTLIEDTLKQAVTALSEIEGLVYAGYRNGLIGLVSGNKITPLQIQNRAPSSAITALRGREKLLYAATEDEGLFLIVNNTGLQLTTAGGLTDQFLYDAVLEEDGIMVATDRGINYVRFSEGKPQVTVFTTEQGLPDNIVRVIRSIPGSENYWLGTQEGGVALYDGTRKSIRRFNTETEWAWGQVNDILPTSASEAWIATEEGYLIRATMLVKDSLGLKPFLYETVKLKKLLKDKTGNIWCATNKGLLMNTAIYATSIEILKTYQLSTVTAISCDSKNNIWFAQNNALYRAIPGDTTAPQLVTKTIASITCLLPDQKGNLWIGTFGKGLFFYSKGRLMAQENIAALAGGHILSLATIKDRLWIASLNGVEETQIVNEVTGSLKIVKHHNKQAGTGSDYVYQLYPDSKGRMWMATDGGGVCMYDGRSYHRWNESSGLTSDVVYTIAEDAGGDIWAGTLEKGLFRLRENKWQQFTKKDGLQHMNIYALRGTGTGQMVVVNEEGIDVWYPNSGQFRHFNRRLGIGIDSTLAIPNGIAGDQDGNVYVPFEQGFIKFGSQPKGYDLSPVININGISLFNKPLHNARQEFASDENHLSFHYDGLNFSTPERLHYRYKLDNYDSNWVYTSDEVISFAQLPPGSFRFRVQTSLTDNFLNATEANWSFTIVKPFWQKFWFIALAVLVLSSAAYGYVKIREANLKKLSGLQRERMIFEYEHLKSQVNPHFLFNSLNTLVSLIEDDKEAAVDYTVHLSDLYRKLLSYKDQDLITLAEEYEIIKNYMHIQKSRFGNALRLETKIPETLFATKRIVPMALQLLVENAIKHNVVSTSSPLTISIEADENTITVRNIIQPKASKEKGAGLGLVNIKKRYSLLTSRSTRFGAEGNEYLVRLPLL